MFFLRNRISIEAPRFVYNEALYNARNCLEHFFGILKSTWRCLSRHRVLQYEPSFAGRIVNTCVILHTEYSQHI